MSLLKGFARSAWSLWQRQDKPGVDREVFIEAATVPPLAHLQMQAALQPWVDNAISKTINVAADIPFDEFRGLYTYAYAHGLKGCTVFRPNPIRGAVLEAQPSEPAHCCTVDREAD